MTPDKVEEIVEEFDKKYGYLDMAKDTRSSYWSLRTYLSDTLTKYHQDLMSEVVEEIETMTVKQSTVNFKVNEGVMDFANNLLNEFKREAQDIIKSK